MPRAGRTVDRDSTAFLAIVALVMAMPASSIDLLLPTFPRMREAFGLAPGSTEVAAVITAFFLGLAFGQLVYGPLSDRYGRKPVLYAGLAVFVVGAAGAIAAPSLGTLVAWRALWGFGAAAPRSLAMAIVRDSFEGDRMARAMSLIMAIFIMVPVVAPSVGSGVLAISSWRVVLGVPVGVAAVVALLLVRMPETLAPADRRPLHRRALGDALRIVTSSRTSVTHGLAATCLFGVLVAFIGTVEAMIDQVFHASGAFPLLFAGLAGSMAVGSLLSARLVVRYGLTRLLRALSVVVLGAAALHAAVVVLTDGRPPLWAWLLTMALLLPSLMMLLPNTNTAAMGPLGEVAGMGAAILGAVMTGGGALLGAVADGAFDGTAAPFGLCALAFAGVAALLLAIGHAPAVDEDVPLVAVADA